MATTIVHPSTSSVDLDLSEVVLTYLQAQHDAAPSMAFVEAMCLELAQVQRLTQDDTFTAAELQYAYLVASGSPIGFDDVPASLLPDC